MSCLHGSVKSVLLSLPVNRIMHLLGSNHIRSIVIATLIGRGNKKAPRRILGARERVSSSWVSGRRVGSSVGTLDSYDDVSIHSQPVARSGRCVGEPLRRRHDISFLS